MLFDEAPKRNLHDLFARDADIRKLERAIFKQKSRLVIISGIRRVGKTSLLRAFLNEKIRYSIFIDPRHLARKESISRNDVLSVIQSSFQEFLDLEERKGVIGKLKENLKHVRGFSFGGGGVELDFTHGEGVDLKTLFSKLDEWAEENSDVVLAIDEAHEFSRANDIDLTGILAYIYDNCLHISMILTGSEIGLLYEFLGFDKPTAYLFGRNDFKIYLKPLERERSKEFLIKGFEEKGMAQVLSARMEVIDKAVANLDGILGWLVKFANKCLSEESISEGPIVEIQKEGSILARSEFDKYLRMKKKIDAKLMNEIMKQTITLRRFDFNELGIKDSKRGELVEELAKEGYLLMTESKYVIPDPLLLYSFERELAASDSTSNITS